MRSSSIRFPAYVLAVVLMAASASAATFGVYDDRELVRRADAIVIASALTSYSQIAAYGGVETVTPMSVETVLKGAIASHEINVHEPGGMVGDRRVVVAGAPQFRPGERVLLFLVKTPSNTWAVADLVLGKFSFETDRAGQKLLVRQENDIAGWDSSSGRPHVEKRRNAQRFLDFVRTEARGGVAKTNYIVDYHPLRLRAESLPQERTASSSARSYTLDVELNTGAGKGSRWAVFPQGTVAFFTQSTAPARGLTALTAAIAAWNGECESNVQYSHGGTNDAATAGITGSDLVNAVLFERNLVQYGGTAVTCGGGGYSGTLGVGAITKNGAGDHIHAGESFLFTEEGDVEMAAGLNGCGSFPNGDFASAVTHELGHTLGFRHSNQNRVQPGGACVETATFDCEEVAIMRHFIPPGLNATLQQWDLDAVRALYPSPGNCLTNKVRFDISGDGKADLFWRNTSIGGANSIWFMNGPAIDFSIAEPNVDASFSVAAIGDISGDGKADIVWRNNSTGVNVVWLMNGGSISSSALITAVPDTNWKIVGIGDFQGDGKEDLLWRNQTTGDNAIWFMNGATVALTASLTPVVGDGNFRVGAVGDFQGDGKADIIWRNSVTGANIVWLMNGTTIAASALLPTVPDPNWNMVGVGDMQDDGNEDVIWRNTSSGDNAVWFMSGLTMALTASLPSVADTNFTIARVGDFQGDGKADIMWRNYATGANAQWLMNGPAIALSSALPTVGDTNWTIVP